MTAKCFTNVLKLCPIYSCGRQVVEMMEEGEEVQEIKMEPGTALAEYINAINGCYPEEIVKYYSPGYSEQLLDRVEQYQPLN